MLHRTTVNILIVAVCAVCLLITPMAMAQKKNGARPPLSVEVAKVMEREVSASVSLVGSVRAYKQAMVSAEVTGKVISFKKREGDKVAKGEAIARLDGAIYKISVRETNTRLHEAKTELAKTKLFLNRATELYSQKIGSQEAKQNSELDVQLAESKVSLRQAELDRALYNQDKLKIRAPFGGFLTAKLAEEGYWVEKGDNLFEIVDTHKVEVIAEAPERLMSAIAPNKEVTISFDALQGRQFKGTVSALVPKANQNTRTFPVRIVMDNPDYLVMAGMFARVDLPTAGKRNVLLVPRDAVVMRSNKALVFAMDGTKRVSAQVVSLGRQHGEQVEVTGDIHIGMTLVVTGNEILQDGQSVTVLGEK